MNIVRARINSLSPPTCVCCQLRLGPLQRTLLGREVVRRVGVFLPLGEEGPPGLACFSWLAGGHDPADFGPQLFTGRVDGLVFPLVP